MSNMHQELVEALHATTVASDQKQAGEYLDKCTQAAGFAPELLKIACDGNINPAVRQAAVIYFKNTVVKFWKIDDDDEQHKNEFGAFVLTDGDKAVIKQNILDAICIAGDNTRPQLCVAAQQIMRTEFPNAWPELIPSIQQKLVTPDASALHGALLLIYRMSKVYEYKRAKERQPLVDTMKVLLPVLQHHFSQLAPNESQESVTIQKLILKIYYSLVQFSLNLDMIPCPTMDIWLEFCRHVLSRRVPEEVNLVEDLDERSHMVWWKCKKWAAKIVDRVFERYGAPGQVEKGYTEFANHFLQNFSIPCVDVMMHILSEKCNGSHVSDRVLHLALSFLNTSISHSHTWVHIKKDAQQIITTVLFPILCHSDEDEELWQDDVEEYVRFKYDIFEDMHNPAYAAGSLLCAMGKRKDVMPPVLAFTLQILASSTNPREIDGALRMLGELSPQLCKSKKWKKDLEKLLDAHVIGRVQDPCRFVRARSAWCIKQFSSSPFHSKNKILKKVVDVLVHTLCSPEEELPAKVECALALESLLDDQEEVHDLLQKHVARVIPRVLELAAQTQIEDVVGVMDELMEQFIDDVVPIAADIAKQMSDMFLTIVRSEVAEDRTPALMSIISTLSNVLEVVSDHREIMVQMEASVLRIITYVFNTSNIDYYDEIMLLIQSLIMTYVSEPMWQVFDMVYHMVKTDLGIIMFSDVVPILHLYVTTDTESFLARPHRLNAIIDMCKSILENEEQGDENQLHAAKLLEVIILQCDGLINDAIPAIVVIALERLTKKFEDGLSELKHMLLLVVIAALYTNTDLAVRILKELAPDHPNPLDYLTEQLMSMSDQFEGVHNRRMAVFAWCILLRLPAEYRPNIINSSPQKAIESCLAVFKGLQRALKAQAETRKAELEDDSDDDEDEEDEDHRKIDDDLSDNDDEIDESTLEYLDSLAKDNKRATAAAGDADAGLASDSDDDDDEYSMFEEETDTEQFVTVIDEENSPDVFVAFKQAMELFKEKEPALFHHMVSSLGEDHTKELHELDQTCDNHVKSAESKKVKEAGGYVFNAEVVVPGTFNFGQ